jgi:tetratricopeptide (TPR) repeat protein
VFLEEAISCERCHGPSQEHLKHPGPGSIVNPAKLAPAARDSICEQCHLVGVTQRILNPGKHFADFHPGRQLEDVFTLYTRAGARAFRVISHAEQLALSACARGSQGKMWCGTCHDPHPQAAPTPQFYNRICQTCHAGKLAKSHPAATNCVTCHMARRSAQDGGHTVFTDHRIRRKPDDADDRAAGTEELRAWRPPEPKLQARNLGLAYVNAGMADRSPAEIARGYGMLAEFQPSAPDDIEVLKGIGRAVLAAGHTAEALKAFEWVLKLAPDSAAGEEELGVAFWRSGQLEDAASHLERALKLDPLLLSAGTALQEVYREQGNSDKADALAERMRRAMLGRSQ